MTALRRTNNITEPPSFSSVILQNFITCINKRLPAVISFKTAMKSEYYAFLCQAV